MLRNGVDVMDIERIQRAAERHGDRFYSRFYTEAEAARYRGKWESLAARFAAKEAVAKALGTGIGDVEWVEIEVVSDERGKPELQLHGKAAQLAERLGLHQWSISLTHVGEYAMAMVIAM